MKVKLFKLLQDIKEYLNNLIRNIIITYCNIGENNNKELREQNIKNILSIGFQYNQEVNLFTSVIQTALKDMLDNNIISKILDIITSNNLNSSNRLNDINSLINSIIDELDIKNSTNESIITDCANKLKDLLLKIPSSENKYYAISKLFTSICAELKNNDYKDDIFNEILYYIVCKIYGYININYVNGTLNIINVCNQQLFSKYKLFLNNYKINVSDLVENYNIDVSGISDNNLYALIIFSCAKNENIIIQINDMIIKLIENLVKNVMKQSSSGDYNKYRNNLLKINKINHLNRHSGNILIVKYYDKNNKEESHSFKSYFAKILNNLSLINYNELNNEMDTNNIQNDEQLLSFVSDYNTNKRNTFLKKIINQTNKYINTINNIENIKVQSCIIDKNILNKECMEEYKQIINDLVENCCPILKECKPLINNIGNKAKKLLNEELQETDGNSLNKSSKNEKTINMSEMEFNQIIQTAREKGMQEGLKLGKMQGKEKGMKDGIIEGENNKAMEIAKNLFDMKLSLDMKLSIEQISQATGLSINVLNKLFK